jgi:hypothetical protein
MMTAMGLAGRFSLFPLHHQLEVRDAAGVGDCPQWESGEEPVLAASQCIVLATRPDLDGPVQVEVWVGALDKEPAGALLYEGELQVTEHGVVVGSSLTEELHPIALPIGWHPVRIWADRPTEPAHFTVLFDGQPANRAVASGASSSRCNGTSANSPRTSGLGTERFDVAGLRCSAAPLDAN